MGHTEIESGGGNTTAVGRGQAIIGVTGGHNQECILDPKNS